MANKDFFDEEFEKLEKASTESNRQDNRRVEERRENSADGSARGGDFDSWSSYQAPSSAGAKSKKPLYIVLICLALVLCIALGWVLCAVFGGIGASKQEKLLSDVMSILNSDFYKEVPQEDLWKAVENAGTALLQTAGDQYSRLMSPQTYYNFMHPTSVLVSGNGKVFGMTFQVVGGVGLYVSSVVVNSNSYGKLQEGDIIVKLTDITDIYGKHGVTYGTGADAVTYNEIVLDGGDELLIRALLALVDQATFHVLRNGSVIPYEIARGEIGYVNSQYPFEYVEFYFGDNLTNVSTAVTGGAVTCTKDERRLDNLSQLQDTGYIRISEFSSMDVSDGRETSADDEFRQALLLFKQSGLKRLILDLKGNPGGDVEIVSNIAGMLISADLLTPAENNKVARRNNQYLITTLKTRSQGNSERTVELSRELYFTEKPNADKPDIVVWTDRGSASASELLTGALLDYGMATQMGTRTYGKGIAQVILPMTDYPGTVKTNDGGTATEYWHIYFTVASYYSPVTDTNIHDRGYTPAMYNNLDTYDKLWQSTIEYFNSSDIGGGGIQA